MNKCLPFWGAAVALTMGLSTCLAGENRKFEVQRLELCKQIQKELLLKNECSDPNDCTIRKLLFCSPAKNGIGIQLWGIKSDSAIESALNAASRFFLQSGEKTNIYIKIYKINKFEALARPVWLKDKSHFEINFLIRQK